MIKDVVEDIYKELVKEKSTLFNFRKKLENSLNRLE